MRTLDKEDVLEAIDDVLKDLDAASEKLSAGILALRGFREDVVKQGVGELD